jgi:hypothetical protein
VNPLTTDGYGHWFAYLQNTQLYTLLITHPLLSTPLVLPDQALASGGTSGYTPAAEVPAGAVNGVLVDNVPVGNTVFTLNYAPIAGSLLLTLNNLPQTPGLNYSIAGNTITFAAAPLNGFQPYAYYWH